MLIRCRELNSSNESQIRCNQYNFTSESQIRCRTHNSAANVNSLQTIQFRQRITNFAADNSTSVANPKFAAEHTIRQWMLIRCTQLNFGSELQIHCKQFNFGSESQIRCRTHNSTVNVNLLHPSQFRQRITISLQTRNLTLGFNKVTWF
jgi:hypothetical protein